MNKKEALKELEEIKKRMDVLEGIINKPEVKYYDIVTPVDGDGDILFNSNKQLLCGVDGLYAVVPNKNGFKAQSKDFVWVPCKREDIKMGDTFYCTDLDNKDFSNKERVKKALKGEAGKYCYLTGDEDIRVYSDDWEYYYKLAKRSEL